MRPVYSTVLAVLLIFSLNRLAWATPPTKEEAKAMVKKAVMYYKANGRQKALAEFSNPHGQFVNGDLYLTVWDFNGNQIAHGANHKLIGKNLLELKDITGKTFVKNFMETTKSGNRWVSYTWTNPVRKKAEIKHTYLEAVADIIIGAGVYESSHK